ncbi:Aste57867_8314 [Aphanomyces stellatus]|uniref:Aste57867_8314 protein n=1 Tax=Aphanomyces stellatus TaxID=120398 RepID=A0A485KJZ2_9STRA|nr:hypothetical protein As57867_008282 [Aphanomyces stellatus]VFT85201.1 Aste57867_8314 [Aphanomyces stellatus]
MSTDSTLSSLGYSLPRRDTKTLFHLAGYFLYLVVTVALPRLVGWRQPVVPGWTIKQELVVAFIRYISLTETTMVRKMNIHRDRQLRSSVRHAPVHGPGFHGVWVGSREDAFDATVLYLHGGGYTVGTAMDSAQLLTAIQSKAKLQQDKSIRMFSLEYSLAPEAKAKCFPSVAAFRFLAAESSKPIVLMGASAGGNLTLALMLALKSTENQDVRAPSAAVLFSPSCDLDLRVVWDSYATNSDSDYIGLEGKRLCANDYVGLASPDDPLVSPLRGNFRGCCPSLIHYGGKEVLCDQIEALILRLKDQGVDVAVAKEPLAPHVVVALDTVFPQMAQACIRIASDFTANAVNP